MKKSVSRVPKEILPYVPQLSHMRLAKGADDISKLLEEKNRRLRDAHYAETIVR